MLSMVDPSKSMDKKIFKDEMDILESTLSMMQQAVAAAKIPVVVVFEGWSASGKGTNISKLVQPLDPRSFNVYTMGKTNEDILMRPFLWPYFTRLPAKGRIAIFDKSWHRIATPDGMEKLRIRDKDVSTIYRDINAFDRLLTDDGALLVKLFLHIGREEQRKRFKELEKSPDTAWRVEGKDWQQNERYDQYLSMFEKMLDMTDTHDNPWHIIESEDRKYSTVKIYRTIISIINARLNERAEEKKDSASAPGVVYATEKLRGVPAGREADEEYYKRETGSLQKELDMLGNRLYAKRRSAVIVFEGWDAAGKGGCIKRITEELDPRCYEVVPIGAPSQEELSRHYLWRFYNKLPKDGHFAIFDRSWYGRVLVERVERLTPEVAIRRAYREINEMEAHWRRHGALIIKFWLQIGMDEQLKRFSSRQEDPLKRYKITDEDWRNREKWAMYEQAVEEMIAKTDTPNAPWTIVDSNNKRYARMLVLQTVTEALREALK